MSISAGKIVMRHSMFYTAAFACLLAGPLYAADDAAPTLLRGVNIAGGEFGGETLPGVNGTQYLLPPAEDIDGYAALGMNVIRVPFLWERLQPRLNGPLAEDALALLDQVIKAAARRQVTVILDPHDYGSYRGQLIGSASVPTSAFVDFWRRVAAHYKDSKFVAFGLMNEPNRQSAEEWAQTAQAVIDGIRSTGARQLILVPGTLWSGAHSWAKKAGARSNAEALAAIHDPADHLLIEAHQYFDADSSGTHPDCVSADIGEKSLAVFTRWLRETGHQGFLGEFGASGNPVCLRALDGALTYMAQNADVWRGWTYWNASRWMPDYMFSIYPPDPAKKPQLKVLQKALAAP